MTARSLLIALVLALAACTGDDVDSAAGSIVGKLLGITPGAGKQLLQQPGPTGAPPGGDIEGQPISFDSSTCEIGPSDTTCEACAKRSCCSLIEECVDDTICFCMIPCERQGSTEGECEGACNAPNAASTDLAFSAAASCISQLCPACTGVTP